MSENGVRLTERFTIVTDARTLRALLTLIQRVPMTDLEAVAVEDIFGGWFTQLNDQAQAQRAALETLAAMASQMSPDQPTLDDLEIAAQLDQIDQTLAGAAAGDVLAHESPPDKASGLLTNGGD